MNRRMRKKKHKGEFNTLGFDVEGTFDAELPLDSANRLTDAFIDFVEHSGMQIGGGFCKTSFGFFVTAVRRIDRIKVWHKGWGRRLADLDATDEHRRLVREWFENNPIAKPATVTVGPLKGSWT